MMRAVPLILLLLVLGLAACGDDAPSSGLSGELRYVKSGGFAGEHLELVVQPDGSAKLKSRREGERSFSLSDAELQSLAESARDLPAEDSTPPRAAPDAFVHTVAYEGRTATTDDSNLGKSGVAPLIGELQKILDEHRG